jgi:hypothetical protein
LGRSDQYEKASSRACCRVEFKYEGNIITDSQSHPNLDRQGRRASRPLHEARLMGTMFNWAFLCNCRRHRHQLLSERHGFRHRHRSGPADRRPSRWNDESLTGHPVARPRQLGLDESTFAAWITASPLLPGGFNWTHANNVDLAALQCLFYQLDEPFVQRAPNFPSGLRTEGPHQ